MKGRILFMFCTFSSRLSSESSLLVSVIWIGEFEFKDSVLLLPIGDDKSDPDIVFELMYGK